MTRINQFQNPDIKRQERNSHNRQKKNHQELIEGTIVNSYAKDDEFLSLKERLKENYRLKNKRKAKKHQKNPSLPKKQPLQSALI